MKLIKVLGPAVVAALTAIALTAATSAMATSTSLCDQDSGGACPAGHIVTHVHVTTAGQKAKLLTNIITVECEVLFLGETLNELGAPLELTGNFTYSSCSNSCTVTEENGPAFIEVLKVGHETANVAGEAQMKVSCSLLNCRFNSETENGPAVAKGPLLSSATNGEVVLQEAETHKVSGTFCPTTALLDIAVTPLSPIYIAE